MLKILLLATVAIFVWWLTRPHLRRRRGGKTETSLVQCKKCGIYHPSAESCKCKL